MRHKLFIRGGTTNTTRVELSKALAEHYQGKAVVFKNGKQIKSECHFSPSKQGDIIFQEPISEFDDVDISMGKSIALDANITDVVGLTWTDLGQQASQTRIYSLVYLGNGICLAGTLPDGKILRSTDYGLTWSDLGQQFSQIYIWSLAYLGNGICLAGTGNGGKILRSTDYGLTWSDLGQQFSQTRIYSLVYLGNGICLAGTYSGGKILRSTDYGETWTDLGTQFSQTYIWSLAYLGNGICLAGTYPDGKILRSTDVNTSVLHWMPSSETKLYTYLTEDEEGNKIFVKVAGVWKEGTLYVNVGGTWKQASPNVNVSGTWK